MTQWTQKHSTEILANTMPIRPSYTQWIIISCILMFLCSLKVWDMSIFVDIWPVWYSTVLKYCISKSFPPRCHGGSFSEMIFPWLQILHPRLLIVKSLSLLNVIIQFGCYKDDTGFGMLGTDLVFYTFCITGTKAHLAVPHSERWVLLYSHPPYTLFVWWGWGSSAKDWTRAQ